MDAIKQLVESGIITEDTHQAIKEAWDTRLQEAREELRSELREEFAQRYEHDKAQMVEAIDKVVSESLTQEIQEFQEEKRALAEDRARFNTRMVQNAKKFDSFMLESLAKEIKELRNDRKLYETAVNRLDKFVIKTLAEEIQEFSTDKRAVVETRVRLVNEAKQRMSKMQQQFIARSAELVKESVSKHLTHEMTQLKEDIQTARENMFGRRLFEAFASEFAVTHLNENQQLAKLAKTIELQSKKLEEARTQLQKKNALLESKKQEVAMIKESAQRHETMAKLLKPLNKEKAAVMSELLESVKTDKLQTAFDKYLPSVLNNSVTSTSSRKTAMLTESRVEVTGNKSAARHDAADTVVQLQRLAGLK